MGGILPRINIGADVWGESSIMTGVYERWCLSTLHEERLSTKKVTPRRKTHGSFHLKIDNGHHALRKCRTSGETTME